MENIITKREPLIGQPSWQFELLMYALAPAIGDGPGKRSNKYLSGT